MSGPASRSASASDSAAAVSSLGAVGRTDEVADAGGLDRSVEHPVARRLVGLVEAGPELGGEAAGGLVVALGHRGVDDPKGPGGQGHLGPHLVSRNGGRGRSLFSRARLNVRT
ncbi:MAG: hypothetical protein WKF86_01410 [Acidimicrobiales bacterium]